MRRSDRINVLQKHTATGAEVHTRPPLQPPLAHELGPGLLEKLQLRRAYEIWKSEQEESRYRCIYPDTASGPVVGDVEGYSVPGRCLPPGYLGWDSRAGTEVGVQLPKDS